MAAEKNIRVLSIAVWVAAGLLLLGIAFVRAPQSRAVSDLARVGAAQGGARPVMYEFSTET